MTYVNFNRVRSDKIPITSYITIELMNYLKLNYCLIRSDKYHIRSYKTKVHVGQIFFRLRPDNILHDKDFWSASYQILHDKNFRITGYFTSVVFVCCWSRSVQETGEIKFKLTPFPPFGWDRKLNRVSIWDHRTLRNKMPWITKKQAIYYLLINQIATVLP